MKINAPRLGKVVSVSSEDGLLIQFAFINAAGANLRFTLPFSQLGTLIAAIQKAAHEASAKLRDTGDRTNAAVLEGLATALQVDTIAMGCDIATGDALLWLETADSGAITVRVNDDALSELEKAISQHRNETAARNAAE
jgi:hypothetical protein